MLVGVPAPYESSGEIVDPLLSSKAGDYFATAMNAVATVGLGEHVLEHLGRTQIVALDSRIRADCYVLNSHQVAYVVKVINDVVDGHRFAAFNHEGNARDSHNSAPLCQLPDRFIC